MSKKVRPEKKRESFSVTTIKITESIVSFWQSKLKLYEWPKNTRANAQKEMHVTGPEVGGGGFRVGGLGRGLGLRGNREVTSDVVSAGVFG